MTSTNYYSGLKDGRNSSRVLRPPGGSNTDVLGLSADSQAAPGKKMNPRNISSITEGTNQVTTPTEESKPVTREPPKINETAPTNNGAPAPQNRGRVPPGGFSSGFW